MVVVAVLVGEVGSFLGKTHEADTARALLLEHVTFYAMLPEKRAMNQPSVERGKKERRRGEVCLCASCDKTQVAKMPATEAAATQLHLQRVLCFFLCDVHMSRCEINAC